MSKSIQFKNNTYLDTSSIAHNKHSFKEKFQENIMNVSNYMIESNWMKLCNIHFDSHVQGEFVYMKIFIGNGNNGEPTQNAYIELIMQLGWTGSYGGRLGCSAILLPIQSSFTTSNTSIKVIANSNIDYDIWIHVSSFYCKTNYVVEGSSGLKVTPKWNISTEAPTGTECNLSYTN